ncbi:MAG TPA: L,D-transpeptidase family protein [Pyrinomonadaceae bacterium]
MKSTQAASRLCALAFVAIAALTLGGRQTDESKLAVVSSATAQDERARAEAAPTPAIDNGSALKLPLARPRLLVLKARRQLILFDGERALRLYRIGLGTSPVGDKEREGDRRTPEGDFYVCVKNAQSAFYLSLGLSYPNEEHAARGLRERLITRAEHARITRALRRKRTPPWTTALGGEIFIHGRGSQSDWTWGCVALDDPDMKELFDAVPVGAPVRIEP